MKYCEAGVLIGKAFLGKYNLFDLDDDQRSVLAGVTYLAEMDLNLQRRPSAGRYKY